MPINIPIRNFDDITKDSKRYLIDNSKIKNLNRTSTAKLILDSIAFEEENMYDFQRSQMLNAYLTTANGEYLDEIGYLFSCNRRSPQKANDTTQTNFRFFIDPTYGNNIKNLINEFYTTAEIQELINNGYSNDGTDLIIPKNIKCTNLNENIIYYTNDVVTISSTSSYGYSSITSESNGERYNVAANVISKHTLNEIPALRKIANYILCENKYGITNGDGYEDDENYRWRISNKVTGNSNANESSIRLAAYSVPGVRSITIIPKAYGTGTFKVFVEGISPIITDGLLNSVKEVIQRVSSVGENVYVDHPDYIGIEMQIQLLLEHNANRNLLKEGVRTAIIDYINNLDIGGEIIINEIIQRVMEISTQIKDMTITLFGYGDYNKTTGVNENFTPLRLSNQTASWKEKFYTNNKMCSICEFGALS